MLLHLCYCSMVTSWSYRLFRITHTSLDCPAPFVMVCSAGAVLGRALIGRQCIKLYCWSDCTTVQTSTAAVVAA